MMKKVTLVKSLIGAKPNQKATAASLGLSKIGDSITHEDNAVLAGKVKVISHLVKVENA
ncbi:MAG: 50S ribosomal protein L30 [Clostridia bacterium]|nr:50S ribosomal protein L30 [Clostridia bacterium]